MIVFDYAENLKAIKKNGIDATDKFASSKIDMLLTDMIYNSTYTKDNIIKKVKKIASAYYDGMPDNLINAELSESYKRIRSKGKPDEPENKIITLYKSEMETIAELPNDKLQALAFASLVAFKWQSQHYIGDEIHCYKSIAECMSDIYMIAHFEKVSGTVRMKLQNELSNRGLVKYRIKTNPSYRYQAVDDANRKRWIAFTQFSVPFAVEYKGTQDDEEIYTYINNYDDVMLYWRLYIADKNISACKCCGAPIEKTTGSKMYCRTCAARIKKEKDNSRYMAKKAI